MSRKLSVIEQKEGLDARSKIKNMAADGGQNRFSLLSSVSLVKM